MTDPHVVHYLPPRRARAAKARTSFSLPLDQLQWIADECDRRVVSRDVLARVAFRLLIDAVRVAPDLLDDLPPVPTPSR